MENTTLLFLKIVERHRRIGRVRSYKIDETIFDDLLGTNVANLLSLFPGRFVYELVKLAEHAINNRR